MMTWADSTLRLWMTVADALDYDGPFVAVEFGKIRETWTTPTTYISSYADYTATPRRQRRKLKRMIVSMPNIGPHFSYDPIWPPHAHIPGIGSCVPLTEIQEIGA
jgi:hypothetical protein